MPPPAPFPTSSSSAGQPADLLPRFLAKLVDGVVMFFINIVVGLFVAFGLNSGFVRSAIATLISTAITLAYYAFLESSRGQTVGKLRNIYVALGFLGILPVVGFFGSLAELAAVIFIAVTINSDTPLFRGWHDKFADTQVIKTR